MALMDNLLNAATQMLGGNSENGAQGSLTDMAMDLVKQQGGVGNLINQLQQGGLGDALSSWVSNQSSNLPVVRAAICRNALGSDTVNQIAQKFGVDVGQAGDLLAKVLPDLVDKATPNGHGSRCGWLRLGRHRFYAAEKLYEIMS